MDRDEASKHSPLIRGEIAFEGSPSFTKASVHIFLEDTSMADASAQVVVHQVAENVSADMMHAGMMPFVLYGTTPDKRAHYTVRVHVDVDGNGKISQGDYITTVSYPVLTWGYPDRLVVRVNRVN